MKIDVCLFGCYGLKGVGFVMGGWRVSSEEATTKYVLREF